MNFFALFLGKLNSSFVMWEDTLSSVGHIGDMVGCDGDIRVGGERLGEDVVGKFEESFKVERVFVFFGFYPHYFVVYSLF